MKAISGKEMCRILERHGRELVHIKGSHHKYRKGNQRVGVPVRGNQTLKTGMQKGIMEQAELTEADLS
jgi:predicted RNA binding protein YcfA (HicA-like mRNA interferase family)